MSGARAVRVSIALTVALAAAVGAALAAPTTQGRSYAGAACPGSFRWAVKTLSDPAAPSVDYSSHNTTIAALGAVKRPNFTIGTNTPRLPNEEHTTYRVHARLVKTRLEDDGDIHLVIRGVSSTGTMVVELPIASCDGAADSAKQPQMA